MQEVSNSHRRLEDWYCRPSPGDPVLLPQCIFLKVILLIFQPILRKSELLEAHYESVVEVLSAESFAINWMNHASDKSFSQSILQCLKVKTISWIAQSSELTEIQPSCF